MATGLNRGRAQQLYDDYPIGARVISAASILWLIKVARFLLARYIDGE